MTLSDIRIQAFVGSQLRSHLHSIAKLRIEVFHEFPYFKEEALEEENALLKLYLTSRDAIAVLVFDNTTLIGSSIGVPLTHERKAIQKPFLDKKLSLPTYYFFGESVLLKKYRGRGIGHHLFDLREAHVKHLKGFEHICFCVPEHMDAHPHKPKDYIPLNDFWRKRGYAHHPEMRCALPWKHIGEKAPGEQWMTFWVKNLSQ